jgi:Fe-S-cluster-containing hydrogenase component 2
LITIDQSRCKGCGECASACPASAITLVEEKAFVDVEICEGCELCVNVCPHDAIIAVETVEPVLAGESFPDPESTLTRAIPDQVEPDSPPSGEEVLPALSSILVSTGREVLPRLASMALDLLDERIQTATPDSRVERTQSRQEMSTQQPRGRRRRRRRRQRNW